MSIERGYIGATAHVAAEEDFSDITPRRPEAVLLARPLRTYGSAARYAAKRVLFVCLVLTLELALASLTMAYVSDYKAAATGGVPGLALPVSFLANGIYVIFGVLLLILGRTLRISRLTRALPFIALAVSVAMYPVVAFTIDTAGVRQVVMAIGASTNALLGAAVVVLSGGTWPLRQRTGSQVLKTPGT